MSGLHRVWFESLSLTDFRNHAAARLSPGPRSVVLVGRNGAGKTNLLEAVSILSPGRGMRRARYEDMVRTGAAPSPGGGTRGWTVAAEIAREGDSEPVRIGTAFPVSTGGRRIRIDGADAAADDLLRVLKVLWLTPSMDGLFTGPEADRRRFLDRLTLALHPRHGTHATAYEKAMRQRNRLLEDRSTDRVWLDGIETELARHGAAIAAARIALVDALDAVIRIDQPGADFPRGEIAVSGDLEALLAETDDPPDEALCRRYRDGRARDEAAGRTLVGPHRTAVAVTHLDKQMPASMASTGEQKALLVAIVVGHAELAARTSGDAPVLLLDEVAAHLDPRRRAALFARLDALNAQCFMTGTDAHLFEATADRATVIEVADGALTVTSG